MMRVTIQHLNIYSTDRSKAMVPVLIFVALWFILRGDLLYVFPCVILFLCFSVLLVFRLPRLGKTELMLVLFVCLFDLCLFEFVGLTILVGCFGDRIIKHTEKLIRDFYK